MSHRRVALVSGLAFLALNPVMLRYERTMRAAAGQGMIALELAGTPTKAASLIARLGPDGRRAAQASLRWDFAYMTSYATLLAALLRWRFGESRSALPVVAFAGDAAESVLLLRYLGSGGRGLPVLAAVSASTKFLAVGASLWQLAVGRRR